jgi:hypothetical protein
MRNLEDLILSTICIKLSEITEIPTGRVLAKMPDFEYVNKYDGTNQPQVNQQKFPSIGMQYFGKVRYEVNRYGEEPLVVQNASISKIYKPMGELHIPLEIHLFTNSRKEQTEIGNLIAYELSSKKYYYTINDEIDNQYFNIEYCGFTDLQKIKPFERIIHVKMCGQVYSEITGYAIETIIANMDAKLGEPYIEPPIDEIVIEQDD